MSLAKLLNYPVIPAHAFTPPNSLGYADSLGGDDASETAEKPSKKRKGPKPKKRKPWHWDCHVPGCDGRLQSPSEYNIRRHLKKHWPREQWPFGCPRAGCKFRTQQKGNLKSHMYTHEPEKHSQCSYILMNGRQCPYRYSDKGYYLRHTQNVHGVPKKGRKRFTNKELKDKYNLPVQSSGTANMTPPQVAVPILRVTVPASSLMSPLSTLSLSTPFSPRPSSSSSTPPLSSLTPRSLSSTPPLSTPSSSTPPSPISFSFSSFSFTPPSSFAPLPPLLPLSSLYRSPHDSYEIGGQILSSPDSTLDDDMDIDDDVGSVFSDDEDKTAAPRLRKVFDWDLRHCTYRRRACKDTDRRSKERGRAFLKRVQKFGAASRLVMAGSDGLPSSKGPTFYQSLIAGGMAGTSVDLLFYPIDTIKTRLQSSQGFLKAGGFKGIYKGIGSVVVGSSPGAALFFCTYDTLKKHSPLPAHLAPVTHMCSASVGEVVRVHDRRFGVMLTNPGHLNAIHALPIVPQGSMSDGIRGFYRGFGTTIMREIPFTSLQFPLYELLKVQLSHLLGRRPLRAHEAAVCGSISGAFAAAATTPLDVLKTRVMLDMRNATEHELPSVLTRARQIYVNEGPRALFAGVVPRTLWISAGGAVFLGVYEWAVQMLAW
ncbi:hypothetical protein NM688_g628 [Phlebia brevispora]|uniref:Uncharacterized protein n=1 Tax=Phlebia brevispora TaxID=194682 RepID=A0ACC1TE20_9APHY|nr:hypothetical protein NM688_g628 [Phlebia brevispora]